MIRQIAEVIIQKFNQSTELKNVLSGGLYFQQAPQDVSSPYGVFMFVGASHTEIMGATWNNITDISLQFSLFEDSHDGGSAIASIAEILDNAFHWAEIYPSGYDWIKMQRQSIGPVTYIDEIWQVNIDYELSIKKT